MAEPLVNAPPEDALAAWFALLTVAGAATPTAIQDTPLIDAQGLVVARDVTALQPIPPFRVAAMDGFAVRAGDIANVPATLGRDCFAPIDTGEAVGDEWDAVVPIEETSPDLDGIIVRGAVTAGQHVRPVGEDIPARAVVLPAGRRLGPYELGLAASCGHRSVAAHARPRVAILPTGDELRPPGEMLGPGETAESNGVMLAALTRNAGADPVLLPTERDDPDAISRAILEVAAACELLLVLSGSSRGTRDHTADVLTRIGSVAARGVRLRPGHPVILGLIGTTPAIGMPGFPISAAQTFARFAKPLLARRTANVVVADPLIRVELATRIYGRRDAEIMVPVRLERRAGLVPLAHPLSRKGAALRAFATAGAVIHVPPGTALEAGSMLDAERRPGG